MRFPDIGESNEKDPILFFKEFYGYKIYIHLRELFFSNDLDDDGFKDPPFEFDKNADKRRSMLQTNNPDGSPGNWFEYEESYSDYINNILMDERAKSMNLLEKQVESKSNVAAAQKYISDIYQSLLFLTENNLHEEWLLKYPVLLRPIADLRLYIEKRFPRYLLKKRDVQVTSFTFKIENTVAIEQLYSHLKEEKFIGEDTQLIVFKSVFDGLQHSKNRRIKWISKAKNKAGINKQTLFYLFEELQNKSLITPEVPAELLRKIHFNFVDQNDNILEIKALRSSYSQRKKIRKTDPEDYRKIRAIITLLLP